MKRVPVMILRIRASGYATEIQKHVNASLKANGIAVNLPSRERGEKISEFNGKLKELFEQKGVKKWDVINIYLEVEGDENDFTIDEDSVEVFVFKPDSIIKGLKGDVILADEEEFEEEYQRKLEVFRKHLESLAEKSGRGKGKNEVGGKAGEEKPVISLLEFIREE